MMQSKMQSNKKEITYKDQHEGSPINTGIRKLELFAA
ncbi:hypothetical protein ABH912_000472 [Pseudomonas sp. BT76 TE3572]